MGFALEGIWLLGGFAVVYLIGVFTSQWAKDKINGVPSSLRSALKTTEAAAVKELAAARDRLVAETASLLAKGKAAAAAEVKVVEGKITGDDVAAAAVIATDPPVAAPKPTPVVTAPASPSPSAAAGT